MPSILNTSLTGMLAFQRALAVTSNNIANVNTPGYSRQIAEFSTRIGTGTGNRYVGGGTQVSSIRRIYDNMLGQQLQSSTTAQVRFSTLDTLAGRIDILLADANTGLNTSLQSFFNATQDLSSDPASISTRQVLIGEATSVASRFEGLGEQLGQIENEVNVRMRNSVAEVNRLADSIAKINGQISRLSAGGQTPNDLLDARERLVLELSAQVTVSTTTQNDGTMSVFIGSGQPLVVSNDAQMLGVRGSEFDPTRMTVVYAGAGSVSPLDSSMSGGVLGGLLEFRSRMLDPAIQSLGQTAVAFVSQFNEQQQSGMDLRGNLGGEFFAIDPPRVLYSSGNSGSGTATATVANLADYTGANYVLDFDGANYSLTREDSGEVFALSGSGSAADPFVAEGIEIVVAGAPAAGDRLMIRTGQDAATSIRNLISDPQSIAMAAPTRSSASFGNTGSATISAAAVSDRTDPALLSSAVIQFTSPSTYTINGAGNFNYIDGDPITVNGSSFAISGAPAIGDQFTLEPNYGASGDNSNGRLLTDIQARGLLDGGTISINENYGRLVSGVASTTNQIRANLDTQNVLLRNIEDAMLANSGVNLDEEAARLIQYQQAYQAAAQIVSVAQSLFDTLLNATRR